MPEPAQSLGATKRSSTLLVLFVPSKDRTDQPIDQEFWVREALETLGGCFGGATAFPQGRGVWRDDAQGGRLLFDEPVVIQCYTSEAAIEQHIESLHRLFHRLGTEGRQGAVGFVIDRDYLEIQFPLSESEQSGGTQRRKHRRTARRPRRRPNT